MVARLALAHGSRHPRWRLLGTYAGDIATPERRVGSGYTVARGGRKNGTLDQAFF